MTKKICIIPARGGSKRIPRKNIKPFLGIPIIGYSIKAALASNLFDKVMVTTDDDEIAEIAQRFGAEVPFRRSSKNSDDYATTVDVLLEVIEAYKQLNYIFEYGCCIYPTAPFVTPDLLQRSFTELKNKQLDTVFPVLAFSFPIQRALKINAKHRMEMFQPENMFVRSQDLEPAYHDAGQFYWFKSKTLLSEKKLWTTNAGVVILNEMEAQDIDTIDDWAVAELKFKMKVNAKV